MNKKVCACQLTNRELKAETKPRTEGGRQQQQMAAGNFLAEALHTVLTWENTVNPIIWFYFS